jgi:hypothetical protein
LTAAGQQQGSQGARQASPSESTQTQLRAGTAAAAGAAAADQRAPQARAGASAGPGAAAAAVAARAQARERQAASRAAAAAAAAGQHNAAAGPRGSPVLAGAWSGSSSNSSGARLDVAGGGTSGYTPEFVWRCYMGIAGGSGGGGSSGAAWGVSPFAAVQAQHAAAAAGDTADGGWS